MTQKLIEENISPYLYQSVSKPLLVGIDKGEMGFRFCAFKREILFRAVQPAQFALLKEIPLRLLRAWAGESLSQRRRSGSMWHIILYMVIKNTSTASSIKADALSAPTFRRGLRHALGLAANAVLMVSVKTMEEKYNRPKACQCYWEPIGRTGGTHSYL